MNGLPYYKRFPRDFMEGTIGMPFDLKGAYALVLDLIYMQGGRLPDDARYIAGHLGCTTKAWTGYRAKLIEMGKLHLNGTHLTNNRADAELETLAKLSATQREKRLGKSKNKDLQEPQFHQPEPEPEEEEAAPPPPKPPRGKGDAAPAGKAKDILCEALPADVADDFIAHRRAKRAKLTDRAAELIVGKLKAMPDPVAAVHHSIAQGYTGIFEPPIPQARGSPVNGAHPAGPDIDAMFAEIRAKREGRGKLQ